MVRLFGGRNPSEIDGGSIAARRLQGSLMLERSLSGPLPAVVELGGYLSRVAGRQQMAAGATQRLMVSTAAVRMRSRGARATALAVADIMHFIDSGARPEGSLVVYLAMQREDDRLVVAVAVEGEFSPVAGEEATRGCAWRQFLPRGRAASHGVRRRVPRRRGWAAGTLATGPAALARVGQRAGDDVQ